MTKRQTAIDAIAELLSRPRLRATGTEYARLSDAAKMHFTVPATAIIVELERLKMIEFEPDDDSPTAPDLTDAEIESLLASKPVEGAPKPVSKAKK